MTDPNGRDDEKPTGPPELNEAEPNGFLALAGLWKGIMTDEEVDEFIRHI